MSISGSLSAVGSIALLPERGFPMDISTELENFTLLRRDDVKAVSDGKVGFEGTLEAAFLKGRLKTESMELRIPDRLPAQVVELDVTEAAPDVLAPAAATAVRTSRFALGLGLTVEMPGRVFLRGRGLDSEWAGRLKVFGSADRPVVKGKLTLVRGQVSTMGKTFELERGTFDFVGGEKIDPLIDMAATHKDADYTITIEVTGPISSPAFQLSSVPDLPEDEIVSHVLFGKSTAKLDAFEAVQLTSAVSELSGGGGGVLDGMRSALHVDVLRLGTNGADGAAAPNVSAGKYVTEDVYIGVQQGTTVTSGAVEAEVELTPNISIESGVGQTGDSNIGIKFKWDY
jgi:translocation and assembly module TamB